MAGICDVWQLINATSQHRLIDPVAVVYVLATFNTWDMLHDELNIWVSFPLLQINPQNYQV